MCGPEDGQSAQEHLLFPLNGWRVVCDDDNDDDYHNDGDADADADNDADADADADDNDDDDDDECIYTRDILGVYIFLHIQMYLCKRSIAN